MTFSGDLSYFLLILARMSGCVLLNQIFGRNNIPGILKASISLILSVTVYGMLPPKGDMVIGTLIVYVFLIIKEFFIGFLIGYIINLFFSIVVIGGEVLDMQIGMSMSKIYDPNSNVSMGITGSLFNIIFMLIFLFSNGHINLIKIFITSCKLIEIGEFTVPKDLFYNMVQLFQNILVLSLKPSMPIIAVEIILEAGIGILMKAIPQIQVFSVNVQLKLIVGLLLIMALIPIFSTYIDNTVTLMFDTIEKNLRILIT